MLGKLLMTNDRWYEVSLFEPFALCFGYVDHPREYTQLSDLSKYPDGKNVNPGSLHDYYDRIKVTDLSIEKKYSPLKKATLGQVVWNYLFELTDSYVVVRITQITGTNAIGKVFDLFGALGNTDIFKYLSKHTICVKRDTRRNENFLNKKSYRYLNTGDIKSGDIKSGDLLMGKIKIANKPEYLQSEYITVQIQFELSDWIVLDSTSMKELKHIHTSDPKTSYSEPYDSNESYRLLKRFRYSYYTNKEESAFDLDTKFWWTCPVDVKDSYDPPGRLKMVY